MEASIGSRVEHDRYGEGIISRINLTTYEIFFARGGKLEILKNNSDLQIIEINETSNSSDRGINIDEIENILIYTLDKYGMLQEKVELGDKWIDGKMILQPSNTNMQSKEIPIETFFHKIVMLRDRLRVLEQNINSNEKLNDEDKINLQQYITRIYGSLTTFNILFKDKNQYFVGQGSNK